MQFTFQFPADEDDVFADDAFKNMIGKPVRIIGADNNEGIVTDVKIINKGKVAMVTVEYSKKIKVHND